MSTEPCLTTSLWPAEPGEVRAVTVCQILHGQAAAMDLRRVHEEAERAARALLAQFQPGDRIAVWAPNSAEWIILQQGISLAGMVLVALNPAYRAREMRFTLTQSGAAALFCIDKYRGFDMRQLAVRLRSDLPAPRAVVSLDDWDAFVASGDDATPLPKVKLHDMIQVQYTSGTTGFPRGAMLHHMGLVNEATFVAERTGARTRSWSRPCLSPCWTTRTC